MVNKSNQYFAARNGYDGFTSYFGDVFCPSHFTKIFILKGGPGTGKSTLMKRLENAFLNDCNKVDCILCSSDKGSYDGIILEKNDRRIAVIDGTAPHATDPTLPVVCEEIVNLEKAIREPLISKSRLALEELWEKKKEQYALAYHFLLVCGEIDRNYTAVSNSVDSSEEKSRMLYALERLTYLKNSRVRKKLYECFGKDGLYRLTPQQTQSETLSFNRSSFAHEYLCETLLQRHADADFIINCLDGKVDKINMPSIALTLSFDEHRAMDDELISIYNDSSLIAKSHFATASMFHFEMEKYYTDALDFSALDDIFYNLQEKVKVLLSIS